MERYDGGMRTNSDDPCDCPCHDGTTLVHPEPCCAPCPLCGARVPSAKRDHRCGPLGSRSPGGFRWRPASATLHTIAPLALAIAVFALAVWSVAYSGRLLFAILIALGGVVALRRILHPTPRPASIAGRPRDDAE
jgi:hypothetical protein